MDSHRSDDLGEGMPLSSKSNQIAILTIGTEVTSGQIDNTNLTWLARQLTDMGYEVTQHGAVPDDESLIISTLENWEPHTNKVIITGGLGPTSDDKTRDAVAAWCGQPLIMREETWEPIRQRFLALGRIPPASNRRQCFFPDSAAVIPNPVGTAAAFTLSHRQTTVWVLPGPPAEMRGVWETSVGPQLQDLLEPGLQTSLFRFHVMGQPESNVAEIVEGLIEGTNLTVGYRPHFPYIEVKLWTPVNEITQNRPALDAVEHALQPWLVGKDDDDPAVQLAEALSLYTEVQIFDGGSLGYLAERLGPVLRRRRDDTAQEFSLLGEYGASTKAGEWLDEMLNLADPEVLCLILAPSSDGQTWRLGWAHEGSALTEERRFPYPSSTTDRLCRFQVEDALLWWRQSITRKGPRLHA